MAHDIRPHIIIATTAFAPYIGGAEVAVQEIIKRLGSQFRFTIVTARLTKNVPAHDEWFGSEVIRVGCGSSFDKLWLIIAYPWVARKLRLEQHAQISWAIMASYAGAAALLASIFVRVPYVLTLQEGDDLAQLEKRIGWLLPLFKKIFSHAQSIQVIAPFLAVWAQRMGAQAQPLVVPNGVSLDVFSLDQDQRSVWRAQIREQLSIPETAPTVITFSRLVEKNGIADLIDAVIQLPQHHVIIIGDGNLREELEKRACPAQNRIHFLGTHSQDELRMFGAAADVFSRPSLSEGMGIAFLEALALGLPVVATNVGGIPSIITHGEHGLLVEPSSVDQLRDAFQKLQDDRELSEHIQKNISVHVLQYTWEKLSPQIGEWLLQAVKKQAEV